MSVVDRMFLSFFTGVFVTLAVIWIIYALTQT